MDLRGLLSFYFLLLLVAQPHPGNGASSRGSIFGQRRTPAQEIGTCETTVVKQGYPCQEFYVTTKDGYILNMQRIPEGRVANGEKKQPVLLQHGIFADGMTWFTNQPEQNLPMILADNGFDVWIANTRGTRFSRRHAFLDPNTKEYWDWSWDELAANDLPAFVDFIYSQTGRKVHYVGHSLGTLTPLASFSQGLVVDKVNSAVLLSPIAYLSRVQSILLNVAANTFLGEAAGLIGIAEFNPKGDPAVDSFLRSICTSTGLNCNDLVTSLSGFNCCLNASAINNYPENEPQSTSTKNLIHLSQIIRTKVIAKFDGLLLYNLRRYGAFRPPVYNVANLPRDLPLFLGHGGNDAISDVEDVQYLISILKYHLGDNLKSLFVKDYGHFDFIRAVNAKDLVYNEVVDFFKSQK
ncbi:hypothetical protein Patl1_03026 [Pistacia atlantica]|uniref:Uncharacterized protein n=1 Tax=Pistacia atlantica TaxID=434234 RepID=A0ACC1C3Q6_9ROSI|nr:hypothetical protein Patl1_03026 [Pistacia atlantica]